MRVIEITGDPCVGKSTIINLFDNHVDFALFNKKWLLSSLGIYTKYEALNTILYENYMFGTGLFNAKLKLSFKFFLAAIRLDEPLLRRLNIFRNILHKYAIHHHALMHNSSKYLLVDEGISHIPYLFTGGLNDKNKSLFLKFPNNINPWIIKLSIDLDSIIDRLRHRGHKRIKNDAGHNDIKEFALRNMDCNKLQNKLLEGYSNVVYLDLSINHKIENIEKIILKSLNECFAKEKF